MEPLRAFGRFSIFYTRETSVTSCSLSCLPGPSEKGYSKRKDFAPKINSLLSNRPFFRREAKINFDSFLS